MMTIGYNESQFVVIQDTIEIW